MEKICTKGHEIFVTWTYPPHTMKKACFNLMEDYDDAIEEFLLSGQPHEAGFESICAPICSADRVRSLSRPRTLPRIMRSDDSCRRRTTNQLRRTSSGLTTSQSRSVGRAIRFRATTTTTSFSS